MALRWIATGILAMGTSAAQAEKWAPLLDKLEDGASSYVDIESLKFEPGHITAWIKTQYRKPETLAGRIKYDFAVRRTEYDCKERQFRMLTRVYYLKERAVFTADEKDDWHAIVPGTIGDTEREILCSLKPAQGR